MNPKDELATLMAKNSAIIAGIKAGNRTLSDAEAAEMEQDAARIIELKAAIARGEKNAATIAKIADLGNGAGEDLPGNGFESHLTGSKSGFITPSSLKRMAAAEAKNIQTKGLVAAGSNVTPVEFDQKPQPLATPRANRGLLDVIPVRKRDTESYEYVRQSVRTNNADVVAAGDLKPTSVFTVEKVSGKLDVVAHMSEYVGTYLLADNPALEGFLASELRNGIFEKVAQIAATELASVSGAQTQAFQTNVMDSIYLGAAKVYDLGYNPDVVLLSRATYDELMLEKDADGNYKYRSNEDSRLNGLTPVIVTGLTNQAIVLDSSQVAISSDNAVVLKWDTMTRFDHNEVRALSEGRFAVDVYAAPAVVVVATAAA